MRGIVFWRRSKNPLEERLEHETYEAMLAVGMPDRQARSMGRQLVETAKVALKKSGFGDEMYVEGLGEVMANDLDQFPEFKALVVALEPHGVTLDDARAWHSLAPLERQVLHEQDLLIMLSFFKTKKDELGDGDAAGRLTATHYPAYAWDITKYSGDHQNPPLPFELKLRVNAYRDRRLATDGQAFVGELERDGTFNDHIRRLMREGRLP